MHVLFHVRDEFLEELKLSPPPDKVVRLCKVYHTYAEMGIAHVNLAVVANYVNTADQLVHLEDRAGQFMQITQGQERTDAEQKAEESKQAVIAAAATLGLDVRGGTLRETI